MIPLDASGGVWHHPEMRNNGHRCNRGFPPGGGRVIAWMAMSLAAIVAFASLGAALGSTLVLEMWQRIAAGFVFGGLYGSLAFAVFVLPLQVCLCALSMWRKWSRRVAGIVIGFPAFVMIGVIV